MFFIVKMFIVTSVIVFLFQNKVPKKKTICNIIKRRYGHVCICAFRNSYEKLSERVIEHRADNLVLHACRAYDVTP